MLHIRQSVNRTPTELTDDIRGFHQPLPANDRIAPTAGHDRALLCHFLLVIHESPR